MRILICTILFLLCLYGATAQAGTQTNNNTTKVSSLSKENASKTDTLPITGDKRLIIENDGKRVIEYSDSVSIQLFYENVRAVQDSTYFYADSAKLTPDFFSASGNVTILQSDTIQLFSDSLYYSIDSSLAEMYGDVVFKNGGQELAGKAIFYNLDKRIAFYLDTAILTQGSSKLQSVKGRYDVKEKKSFFYHQVIMEGDDMKMQTDSMIFMTEENKVIFLAPTRIKTKDADIYCESGFYYLDKKEGEFLQNAQYVSGDRIVEGEKIIYNDKEKSVIIEGETTFKTEDGTGSADFISYYENTKDLILEGGASYFTEDMKVTGERIASNEDTGEIYIAGNGRLEEKESIIEAWNIDFNKKTGIGLAEGEVVWQDTTSNTKVYSDIMNINTILNATRSFNYDGKPLMETITEKDTLLISCDTLYSFEIPDTTGNSKQYIIGDNDVKILRKDMQAVSDSMVYFVSDSTLSLYSSPIMWSDTTQFNGDTIHLYMKNNSIDKMELIKNAFVLNTSDKKFFNQIKGKTITAFFNEDDLDNFVVEGNAQSVYYVLDEDNAYVGVNTTECSTLKFFFGNNQISGIKGYIEVKQKMIPMKSADHEGLKLAGFKWSEALRPRTIEDLKSSKQ